MYEIFKNSLLSPRKLSEYVTLKGWKTFVYILFLCLLFALPDLISLSTFDRISLHTINDIKEAFNGQDINYQIKNNELQFTSENKEVAIVEILNLNLSVVFDLNVYNNFSPNYQTKHPLIIVLRSDGAYLTTNFLKIRYDLIKYEELGINELDFSLVKDTNNTSFWNDFITFINKGVNKFRFLIFFIGIPSLLISLSFYLLLMILMTTAIITLFNRYMGAKFVPIFKITIFAYTVYTIGSLLALLFGIGLISSFTSILAIIYAMIGTNAYLKSKMINPNL